MKQNEKTNTNDVEAGCKASYCLDCASCYAVNFEEERKIKAAVKNEPSQLYDSEALVYYFYFLPLQRASK